MTAISEPALPFFLEAHPGRRFALYHKPAPQSKCRGTIVYAPPFGDEMNMSRRMAALQSRAFAATGFGVLQIDLFGCGDSSGELREATWDIWRQDLAHAIAWARSHVSPHVILWGLRLGATLAIDFAHSADASVERCIAWQPVISGHQYVTQFLRLRLAGEMAGIGAQPTDSVQALRKSLAGGETVEVGGYELGPELTASIDRVDLCGLERLSCPLHWIEMVRDEGAAIPAARRNAAEEWMKRGLDVQLQSVVGPGFWGTREVSGSPALISSTVRLLEEAVA